MIVGIHSPSLASIDLYGVDYQVLWFGGGLHYDSARVSRVIDGMVEGI